jgi:hypothetical protein
VREFPGITILLSVSLCRLLLSFPWFISGPWFIVCGRVRAPFRAGSVPWPSATTWGAGRAAPVKVEHPAG